MRQLLDRPINAPRPILSIPARPGDPAWPDANGNPASGRADGAADRWPDGRFPDARRRAQRFQFGVLVLRQRLNFHHQRAEVAADCRNVLTEIVHANLGLMLAGDQQQVFEPQRLDGFALA